MRTTDINVLTPQEIQDRLEVALKNVAFYIDEAQRHTHQLFLDDCLEGAKRAVKAQGYIITLGLESHRILRDIQAAEHILTDLALGKNTNRLSLEIVERQVQDARSFLLADEISQAETEFNLHQGEPDMHAWTNTRRRAWILDRAARNRTDRQAVNQIVDETA
jgi:hypothetical protein